MSKTIAICGIRGIPARYGGFETFAEELAPRLVESGMDVRVYGRSHVVKHPGKFYKGVELVLLPTIRSKYLDTPVHTILCVLHLVFNRVDAVLVCNAANSPFIWLLRLFRMPVAVNVDGIERKRAKWNWLGKAWYKLGEYCSVLFATRIIADAEVIRDYYQQEYSAESTVIAYGHNNSLRESVVAKVEGKQIQTEGQEIFNELGIEPGRYLLYVSRLEPENNAHQVIEAYTRMEGAKVPLVIVGDAPYSEEYKGLLRELAQSASGEGEDRVIFAGYRFGADYSILQLGALVYIQATEVGGTHPALVEAMGFGNCIVANGTPENCEVVGSDGLTYRPGDLEQLSEQLRSLIDNETRVEEFRELAFRAAEERYDWTKIASEYKELFTLLSEP